MVKVPSAEERSALFSSVVFSSVGPTSSSAVSVMTVMTGSAPVDVSAAEAAEVPEGGAASEEAADPEDAVPAGEPQADRYRQIPAAAKRRQILTIRKETGCFDMALLCDFCYDNINTRNEADREYPLFNSIADFCCRRWKR
jgi:hypothetical protein